MNFEYLTTSSSQTKKLGVEIAKKSLNFPPKSKKGALIFGLTGNLGGGKTTFLQGFARGLGIQEKILSPTFIIMRKFQIESGEWKVESRKKTTHHLLPSTFFHFDCYRIQNAKEILDLGFKEIISTPENIIAIEWADKIKSILPKKTIIIKFEIINKNTRKIILHL